jgi:hypothetical protein
MTEEHSPTKKKHHHHHDRSPKKTIVVNGEMVRNPEYTEWKESQKRTAEAHPPNDSEVAKSPEGSYPWCWEILNSYLQLIKRSSSYANFVRILQKPPESLCLP